MLERLFQFQIDNNIELEYSFQGTKIILLGTSFISISKPVSFNNLDELERFILELRDSYNASLNNSNVIFLGRGFEEKEIKEESSMAEIIQFPNIKPKYKLAESDPDELSRAVLCINNLYKAHSEQDDEYKKLHDQGIASFKSYKEKKK